MVNLIDSDNEHQLMEACINKIKQSHEILL